MEHDHHHDHRHDHHHDHAAGANARALGLALALTLGFLVVEITGAWAFSSLALLSDAAHMATDSAALAIALLASRIALRMPSDQRSYGDRRIEVLAAAFNALLLLFVAGWILIEAVYRLFAPVEVLSLGMFVIAVAGLGVNLIGMRILSVGRDQNLNMKGAYLELWADAVGSVGVIAGAVVIWLTDWRWVDPLVAVAIAVWVVPRSWGLLRAAGRILMQSVPRGFDLASLRTQILATSGVTGVHDLHLWTLAGDDATLTAHIVLQQGAAPATVRAALMQIFSPKIGQITLQFEESDCRLA